MDLEDADTEGLRELYMDFTSRILPQLAREGKWTITEDHCFQRVVLDNVFEDMWYRHLDKNSEKPAYKQLSKKELISAVRISREMERKGKSYVERLNRKSLEYRGKN